MHPSWKEKLSSLFNSEEMKQLGIFLREEAKTKTIYPASKDIFNAFKMPVDDVKVVIVGQDPYHTPGVANGLAFSVNKGCRIPPSLVNIFKELKDDYGVNPPLHGDLSRWTEEGVMLLNTSLTVRKGEAGSHSKAGWQNFTSGVVQYLSENRPHVVFVLWGKHAQGLEKFIDTEKHTVLKSAHPSPFSADRGFFGSKPFSKINTALTENGLEPVTWSL